jgi:hypothetical protein
MIIMDKISTLDRIQMYITEKKEDIKSYAKVLVKGSPLILASCGTTNQVTSYDPQFNIKAKYVVEVVLPSGKVVKTKEIANWSESNYGENNTLSFSLNDTVVDGKNIGGKKVYYSHDVHSAFGDNKIFRLDSIVTRGIVYNSLEGSREGASVTTRMRDLEFISQDLANDQNDEFSEGLEFMRQQVLDAVSATLGPRYNTISRRGPKRYTVKY